MVYICLLRGINVSGRNKVLMGELRKYFTDAGFNAVQNYIQSGNVIFSSDDDFITVLENVKSIVSRNYEFEIKIVLRTQEEFEKIIILNPFGKAELNRKLVTFLSRASTGFVIDDLNKKKSSDEEIYISETEIYLHCPNGYGKTKLTNSYLEKILGVTCTTRNWRTITKLREIASNEKS